MSCGPNGTDRINSFSLVSYIPDALGDFLDGLRQELVPGCMARAHVTLLPPRPLLVPPERAAQEIRELAAPFPPFHIQITRIRVFPETKVIFADIGPGRLELLEMHSALNRQDLTFLEPYPYHPHITLAHGFPAEQVDDLSERARIRWQEAPARGFLVETLTFVQNTSANKWLDLSEHELRGAMQYR